LGYEFPALTFVVEAGKIAEFAMAVSQKDAKEQIKPIYADPEVAKKAGYPGIPVPPTFPTSFMFWTGGGFFGIVKDLGVDISRLLHGEEEFEYFGTMCAGDVIIGQMKVIKMFDREKRDKPGTFMSFTILETEMKNQRGELVVKVRTTLVER
jgi:acyl dehydratase